MKRFSLLWILLFLVSSNLVVVFSSEKVAVSSSSIHLVTKGDTLWDISKKVYGDPYLWPSLWEVNKSTVSNPHLIYVGQSILLPPQEEIKKLKKTSPAYEIKTSPSIPSPVAIKKEPAVQPASKENAPSLDVKSDLSDTNATSSGENNQSSRSYASNEEMPSSVTRNYNTTTDEKPLLIDIKKSPADKPAVFSNNVAKIVSENYTPDGFIVGMKEEKLLTSQGDIIYGSFPFVKVSRGDRTGIYRRTGKKIYNPSDGRYLGNELVRIGTGRVENVSETEGKISAIIRILVSREPVEKRDWLILEK